MKRLLVIAIMLVLTMQPTVVLAQEVEQTAKARELALEIELLRLQESVRQQKAYEERMKEHAKKLDCIVCE